MVLITAPSRVVAARGGIRLRLNMLDPALRFTVPVHLPRQ